MAVKILHRDGRFYVRTRGGDAELLYRVSGGVMSMYHTFVPESERGKGIAAMLAAEAFRFAIGNGYKVRPDCPYIAHYLEENKELRKYSV